MAVKIRLKRLGKIRAPYYRIVVADSRTKRDGRAIEEIGKYHPTQEPSLIEVDSERAQYWLGVGAQPTEQVLALLKITGDWQKFKGLPGAEGTLRVAAPKVDKKAVFEAAAKEADGRRRQGRRDHAEGQEGRQGRGRGRSGRRGRAGRRGAGRRGAGGRAGPAAEAPAAEARRRGASRRGRGRSRRVRREGRGLTCSIEALEHLVRGIVEHPDDVACAASRCAAATLLEVRVHPEDLGRVIGRSGRTASALRTVVKALAGGKPVRVDIVDVDRGR